jgi:hypothetical protein
MKNGDISNELPLRVIVTTDVFVQSKIQMEKKFKVFSIPKSKQEISRQMLSYLYIYTTRQGVTLELASFDMDEKELGEFMDKLDILGTNPFRYYTAYESIEHLVSELPYRPEVKGVLDIPARQLRYGHWGLDQI